MACPNTLLLVCNDGKTVGAWSKRVVPIFLMSHGCVLGITSNKPIRVSSPIPFKSQLRSRHGGFAIYATEFARAKTERVSREETELLVRKVKVYTIIIFYIVILSFLIFGIFVCCCVSLCVIRVYARFALAVHNTNVLHN